MAEVRPDEVSAILRRQLAGFEKEVDVYDVGTVLQVGDGVARVYGLSKALMSELVEFPHGVFGMVLNLEEDNVGCILFGESSEIKEGDTVKRTGRVASMPVGEADARTRGQSARPADRRPRPDQGREAHAHRTEGARCHPAPAREGTAADRHQGRGRHDPDRPRAARADHRRPADRKNRHRHRYHHQPEIHPHRAGEAEAA